MIERYSRPKMKSIWSDANRYALWLEVEMAVCEELASQGIIPKEEMTSLRADVNQLQKKGGLDPKRVLEIEQQTRHDVIAFTTALAEHLGPESRYIHFGLTSSDVLDTALALQMTQAGKLLREGMEELLTVLKEKALRYQGVATIGRSHGIFAEPTAFGLKFLGFYCEWQRHLQRLNHALEGLSFGKLSGAVGVNAHWDPEFESKVLKRLGLQREPVATQVVPRDRHAEFLMVLGLCGSSLERLAVELRHLQRSEVSEVLEGFKKGQKGSSAMPHKRNPISAENLTGIARLLRSYAQASLENIALWHERDISHSSVERITFPDATILFDYALHRLIELLQGLVVQEEKVAENLQKAGNSIYSGHYLLELVRAGANREESYYWVQECALKEIQGQESFISALQKHPEVKKYLSPEKIKELGQIAYQLRNVKKIYDQVLL